MEAPTFGINTNHLYKLRFETEAPATCGIGTHNLSVERPVRDILEELIR